MSFAGRQGAKIQFFICPTGNDREASGVGDWKRKNEPRDLNQKEVKEGRGERRETSKAQRAE